MSIYVYDILPKEIIAHREQSISAPQLKQSKREIATNTRAALSHSFAKDVFQKLSCSPAIKFDDVHYLNKNAVREVANKSFYVFLGWYAKHTHF